MELELYARQGDLVIENIAAPAKLDDDWKRETGIVFAGDSSGHRHRLMGGAMAKRVGRATQIVIETATQLVHERGNGHITLDLQPGAYIIRPKRERGDSADRVVED